MKKIFVLVLVIAPAWFLFFHIAHAQSDHLVISQVQITGGAGLTTNDFVEIYNPTSADIDLKGMRLVKRTKTGTSDTLLKSWTDSAIVHAHGFYLWANSSFTDIEAVRDVTTSGSIADDNAVAIRNGPNDTGAIIDSVAWGMANNVFVEAATFAGLTSTDANKSMERMPGGDAGSGTDTNNNSLDFLKEDSHPRNSQTPATPVVEVLPPVAPTPPPAEAPPAPENLPPPPPMYSSDILISEFLPNPDGPDVGKEWIELYNNSSADVDLSGWIFDDESTSGTIGASAYTVPDATAIKAQGYLVIDLPDGAFVLNNTGGDTLRLFWPDQSLFKQVNYSDTAKIDQAYAVNQQGVYAWTEFPTPGAANQFVANIETGLTAVAQTSIRINEIFPNPAGTDSGAEWVEVLNTGSEPVYLHNWVVDDGQPASPIGSSAYKIQSPRPSLTGGAPP